MAGFEECNEYDPTLAGWTSVRFMVMGSILLWRAWSIRSNGLRQGERTSTEPFKAHPKLTKKMQESNFVVSFMYALTLFVQSEGVGLMIYFVTSAALDNYTIYLVKDVQFCEYVMQVALYTMALVSFLPCCVVSYMLQGRLYEGGKWTRGKPLFMCIMVLSAATSFCLRYLLVYKAGWNRAVDRMLKDFDYKVALAILVPPVVDGIQTVMLIGASHFAATTRRYLETSSEAATPCVQCV